MSPRTVHESQEENPGISGSDDDYEDNDLDEDLEALRRACMITGMNPRDLHDNNVPSPSSPPSAAALNRDYSAKSADSESDDDLELVRSIQNRFSVSSDSCEPLSLKPLATLPKDASDEEDDFETLLAIQRRFSGRGCGKCNIYIYSLYACTVVV